MNLPACIMVDVQSDNEYLAAYCHNYQQVCKDLRMVPYAGVHTVHRKPFFSVLAIHGFKHVLCTLRPIVFVWCASPVFSLPGKGSFNLCLFSSLCVILPVLLSGKGGRVQDNVVDTSPQWKMIASGPYLNLEQASTNRILWGKGRRRSFLRYKFELQASIRRA